MQAGPTLLKSAIASSASGLAPIRLVPVLLAERVLLLLGEGVGVRKCVDLSLWESFLPQ